MRCVSRRGESQYILFENGIGRLVRQERKSDREALQPVGTITSGTIGSGLRESVVARSTCTSRDRGGAAVTRPLGSFQDIKSGHNTLEIVFNDIERKYFKNCKPWTISDSQARGTFSRGVDPLFAARQ